MHVVVVLNVPSLKMRDASFKAQTVTAIHKTFGLYDHRDALQDESLGNLNGFRQASELHDVLRDIYAHGNLTFLEVWKSSSPHLIKDGTFIVAGEHVFGKSLDEKLAVHTLRHSSSFNHVSGLVISHLSKSLWQTTSLCIRKCVTSSFAICRLARIFTSISTYCSHSAPEVKVVEAEQANLLPHVLD